MKCNIIKDLFPSYIDEICSEESIEAIEAHLKTCESCAAVLKSMEEVQPLPMMDEEVVKAKKPFKKLKVKKIMQVGLAVVITFIIGFPIYQVTLKEPVLKLAVAVTDYIFPEKFFSHVAIEGQEWQKIDFEGEEYFMFDSIFAQKELTNHANNESDITIRVKDMEGQIIIDELTIAPGIPASLKEMKLYEKYQIEIKTQNERTFLCIY